MSANAVQSAIVRHSPLAIAVSGGVDSMLLAHLAHETGEEVLVVHAPSAAVPREATERVKRHARAHRWSLNLIDAGELSDPRYTANPASRCYFCKSNLYARIRSVTGRTIASGANLDDLSDIRPGLVAAKEKSVVHPFIEAGVGKEEIYALAALRGLQDIAKLPAQPCLSSRIETGVIVDADTLRFIEEAERLLVPLCRPGATVRCRVLQTGVAVECAPIPSTDAMALVDAAMTAACALDGRNYLGVRAYRRGSAFHFASAP